MSLIFTKSLIVSKELNVLTSISRLIVLIVFSCFYLFHELVDVCFLLVRFSRFYSVDHRVINLRLRIILSFISFEDFMLSRS